MRINSPGGSAVASDIIAREITLLRESGKPVVACMGDVAASGGYYIAGQGLQDGLHLNSFLWQIVCVSVYASDAASRGSLLQNTTELAGVIVAK